MILNVTMILHSDWAAYAISLIVLAALLVMFGYVLGRLR